MSTTQEFKKRRKKEKRTEDEIDQAQAPLSAEKKKKLKQLDEFIEGVLEEAGEEFLDEFKQVEGQ